MRLLLFIFLFTSCFAFAQLPISEQQMLSRLKTGGALPEKLLSTRSVVFYPSTMPMKELEMVQKSFQRTGIDPVIYFENDYLAAGRDISVELSGYLNKREITNIVVFQKDEKGYSVYITEYNKKANYFEQNQNSWFAQNAALDVLLQNIYRTASNSQKKENLLINDYPETGPSLTPINGKRSEFFAIDLKVDDIAVPKFGVEEMDKELEEVMKSYPLKYKLTEANLSENELRKQGFKYVIRFVHARNGVAKSVLGYDMSKTQDAIASTEYTEGGPQSKNIGIDEVVYKFYVKHIDSGNVFLGTKWDADVQWQQAMLNQIRGFKVEFKIN